MTDEIVKASQNYCPASLTVVEKNGAYVCQPTGLPPEPFSKEYTKF